MFVDSGELEVAVCGQVAVACCLHLLTWYKFILQIILSYLLFLQYSNIKKDPYNFCVPVDVPAATTASPPYQVGPASPVIAMATWICPYLAAVIQSQDSVCGVVRVTAASYATPARKVIMERQSQQKTANVSNHIR